MKLTRCERAVFDHIAALEDKHRIANPSVSQLMTTLPYSERHIRRALAHLEELGVIGVQRSDNSPRIGDPAPQRWTRGYTLTHMLNNSKNTLLMSKDILLTSKNMAPSCYAAECVRFSDVRPSGEIDFYWKWMQMVEENTDRWIADWIKRGRLRPPTVPQPKSHYFVDDPELDYYLCGGE